MEMLAARAWKGSPVKAGDGQGHGYSRPQVVPPATLLFYHTSQRQLRVLLAGVVRPGCLQPHLNALTYKKVSGIGWCQPPFAASPGTGKEAVVIHRPQETETSSSPRTASTFLSEDLGFYLAQQNPSHGHTFDHPPLSPPSRAEQTVLQ